MKLGRRSRAGEQDIKPDTKKTTDEIGIRSCLFIHTLIKYLLSIFCVLQVLGMQR